MHTFPAVLVEPLATIAHIKESISDGDVAPLYHHNTTPLRVVTLLVARVSRAAVDRVVGKSNCPKE